MKTASSTGLLTVTGEGEVLRFIAEGSTRLPLRRNGFFSLLDGVPLPLPADRVDAATCGVLGAVIAID